MKEETHELGLHKIDNILMLNFFSFLKDFIDLFLDGEGKGRRKRGEGTEKERNRNTNSSCLSCASY